MIAKKQIKFTGVLGTNTPNIDENSLAEMLFILETEFNKNPYGRLHISIEETPVKEQMKIGDLVKSKDLTVEVLACGSGRYDRAMIFSMEPFKLISESGDMVWETMDQDHFEVVGKADRQTIENAMLRLANDEYITAKV